MSCQQDETRKYFSSHSDSWHMKAQDESPDKLNSLKQRYDCVLADTAKVGEVKTFLDLGCGSGEMSVLMAKRGAKCTSIDIAPEMVEIAAKNAAREGVGDACTFLVGSALEAAPEGGPFDMAAALGLIEYLSYEQTEHLFRIIHELLRKEGTLAIESRNRLFNVITFNDYTRHEIESGNIEALMAEGLAIAGAADQNNLMQVLASLDIGPELLDSYPIDGIPVSVRHQYTPGQLFRVLKTCGFEPISVRPYHYHIAPPAFLKRHEPLHARAASILQEFSGNEPSLILQSSSYIMHAIRK